MVLNQKASLTFHDALTHTCSVKFASFFPLTDACNTKYILTINVVFFPHLFKLLLYSHVLVIFTHTKKVHKDP